VLLFVSKLKEAIVCPALKSPYMNPSSSKSSTCKASAFELKFFVLHVLHENKYAFIARVFDAN
jgi:hypothetical protein